MRSLLDHQAVSGRGGDVLRTYSDRPGSLVRSSLVHQPSFAERRLHQEGRERQGSMTFLGIALECHIFLTFLSLTGGDGAAAPLSQAQAHAHT